jgi:ribonuclease HI
MKIVVYTDASVRTTHVRHGFACGAEHHVAAWAALAMNEGFGRASRTGLIPRPQVGYSKIQIAIDSSYAEAWAVIAGVRLALEWSPGATEIDVYTDSQSAVSVLSPGARPNKREHVAALQDQMCSLRAERFSTPLQVHWIPGHRKGPGHAQYNRWVDAMAGLTAAAGQPTSPRNRHAAGSW